MATIAYNFKNNFLLNVTHSWDMINHSCSGSADKYIKSIDILAENKDNKPKYSNTFREGKGYDYSGLISEKRGGHVCLGSKLIEACKLS